MVTRSFVRWFVVSLIMFHLVISTFLVICLPMWFGGGHSASLIKGSSQQHSNNYHHDEDAQTDAHTNVQLELGGTTMTRFRRTTKDGTETADALALDSHDKKKRLMDFAVESAKAKYELEMKVSALESENQKNMVQTETVNTHEGTVFDQIIENFDVGRLEFAWNSNQWTMVHIGGMNKLNEQSHEKWTHAYKDVIRTLDPPERDVRSKARVIMTDVVKWLWNNNTDGLEPATPTFVMQMPIGRTDSACLRLVPNPFEVSGFSDGLANGPKAIKTRKNMPVFLQRRPQVFYRGTLRPVELRIPGTRKAIFDMGADPANLGWLNATSDRQGHDTFGKYRYLLDIGGVDGTTWSALRWKMALGSLVFKVDSDKYNWFHKLLRPHVHYIPVKSDLSDLHAQYEWANDHPTDAERIAKAGQEVAISINRDDFRRTTRELMAAAIHDCEMFRPPQPS
mmetsp:Transcript_14469/g.36238  ORF Transcript_14469/g.36238 Transcript_14469/m.36238 type:complete len:452 (-) Transcript_14469:79-1434(-)